MACVTLQVVEGAKEQKTSASGMTTVKGDDNTPVATAAITNSSSLMTAYTWSADELKKVTSLTLPGLKNKDGLALTFIYSVTGCTKNDDGSTVTFYTGRHHEISVSANDFTIVNAKGETIVSMGGSRRRRRQLLEAGSEHSDSEHSDSEHSDSEHPDSEHSDSEHPDSEHSDSEESDTDSSWGEYFADFDSDYYGWTASSSVDTNWTKWD